MQILQSEEMAMEKRSSRNLFMVPALAVAAFTAFLPASNLGAQDKYPTKPITMVVARATGGSSDTGARGIQPFLQKALGVTVVVSNVAGASGIIGTNKVYDSPSDGYTVLIGSNSDLVRFHMNATQTKFGSGYIKAFTAIGSFLNEDVGGLCVNKSSAYKTFADLLAKAKKSSATVGIGGGVGSTDHLTVLMIEKYFGGNWTVVPYPSGGEAAAALLGNHIDAGSFGVTGAADPDKFRILAQSGPKRIAFLPDVPTYVELGEPDMVMDYHLGLFVKSDTPPAIVKTLETALTTAANDPAFKKWALETKTPVGPYWDAKTFSSYLVQADKNAIMILPILQKSLDEMQGKK